MTDSNPGFPLDTADIHPIRKPTIGLENRETILEALTRLQDDLHAMGEGLESKAMVIELGDDVGLDEGVEAVEFVSDTGERLRLHSYNISKLVQQLSVAL